MSALAEPRRRNGRARVLVVMGTRPEAIKLFSPVRALRDRARVFEPVVCSTGQHGELLDEALVTFGIEADHELSIMTDGQGPADVAWKVMTSIVDLCGRIEPDLVMVQGDTTTAMASGLAGFYSRVPVAHVEAGLRTYDNGAPWPEEAHRRILGGVADVHFAPSPLAAENLCREGVLPDRVHVTGNTGIDALRWALCRRPDIDPPPARERRVLVTAHRRESIPEGVEAIARAVLSLAHRFPDVRFQFMAHPTPGVRTAIRAVLDGARPFNVDVIPPCDYVTFVHMLAASHLILTDSGGIQEEAPVLGKPVLVVNPRTARQEPLRTGTARLVGTAEADIVEAATRLLDHGADYERMALRHDPYGDGRAGERIAETLTRLFTGGGGS